ncbi:hypothetical protein OC844_001468 [Tilletia horrida]|nr:hypothetical protein OC844_001468 [Tilletia horrida]
MPAITSSLAHSIPSNLFLIGTSATTLPSGNNVGVPAGFRHPLPRALPLDSLVQARGDTAELDSRNWLHFGRKASGVRPVAPSGDHHHGGNMVALIAGVGAADTTIVASSLAFPSAHTPPAEAKGAQVPQKDPGVKRTFAPGSSTPPPELGPGSSSPEHIPRFYNDDVDLLRRHFEDGADSDRVVLVLRDARDLVSRDFDLGNLQERSWKDVKSAAASYLCQAHPISCTVYQKVTGNSQADP